MITNVSLVSVWVKDQDASLAFYTDVLGFEVGDDVARALAGCSPAAEGAVLAGALGRARVDLRRIFLGLRRASGSRAGERVRALRVHRRRG